jgi:hypothetical protein
MGAIGRRIAEKAKTDPRANKLQLGITLFFATLLAIMGTLAFGILGFLAGAIWAGYGIWQYSRNAKLHSKQK